MVYTWAFDTWRMFTPQEVLVPYERERDVAVEAVVQACRLCAAVQESLVSADTIAKKDRSPVTVADFGAQALVSLELTDAFPRVPLVGEEDADTLRGADGAGLRDQVFARVSALRPALTCEQMLDAIDYGRHAGGAAGRFWVLDPIDGTKGFLRKQQYAVALALIEDGRPVLGVLGCPNLPLDSADDDGPRGCVFHAMRGDGAYVRALDETAARPVSVSDIADAAGASFCESVESAHTNQSTNARIAAELGVTRPPFRIDSQCKYAAIARGDSSIYLRMPSRKDYTEKIWDHAAGWMIVKEAGGEVSDIHGKPLDFSRGRTLVGNQGVVATNGKLHAQLIAAIQSVAGAFGCQ